MRTVHPSLLDVSRIRVSLCHNPIFITFILDRTDGCIVIIGAYFSGVVFLAQNALVHVHRLLLKD